MFVFRFNSYTGQDPPTFVVLRLVRHSKEGKIADRIGKYSKNYNVSQFMRLEENQYNIESWPSVFGDKY